MKTIYMTILVILIATVQGFAQYKDRIFIRNNHSLSVENNRNKNVDTDKTVLNFSFDMAKAKFKTENRASGMSLRGGLSVTKENEKLTSVYPWGDAANGVTGHKIGIGKFWQFYKHVNSNWGVYFEPAITLDAGLRHDYRFIDDLNYTHDRISTFDLGLALGGGAYYRLSDKWWLNASIGYSAPVGISYERNTVTGYDIETSVREWKEKRNTLSYRVAADLRLPSVGFGVTYFIR